MGECGSNLLDSAMEEVSPDESRPPEQQASVLSVEDEDGTYRLIETAFRDLDLQPQLHRVVNGAEALAFLRKTGKFEKAPRPNIVLLNINLPGMSGIDVLQELQSDRTIEDVPVVVFSSSTLNADRAKCLALGAKQVITKPNRYQEFVDAVQCAWAYARIPKGNEAKQSAAGGSK